MARLYITTVNTRGQFALPADLREALGARPGDKLAVSVPSQAAREALVRAMGSVTDLTFGPIKPRRRPEDLGELRQAFIDDTAENALHEGWTPPAV